MRLRKLIPLIAPLLVAACASSSPAMHVPTEAEQRACDAQGGSIEPAFAMGAYVCLLPDNPAPAGSP